MEIGSTDNLDLSISIHVPLAGDDVSWRCCAETSANFYPRPPCGGRLTPQMTVVAGCTFLSTSPLRGTTGCLRRRGISASFLSTSPLRGTTPSAQPASCWSSFLSTSPLRGTTYSLRSGWTPQAFLSTSPLRGTTLQKTLTLLPTTFLSTSPLRGTTEGDLGADPAQRISIHVPLAGDDRYRCRKSHPHTDFYPRPPCGGRRAPWLAGSGKTRGISIHVPLAGDDGRASRTAAPRSPYFYPRPPCGGRHRRRAHRLRGHVISIHVPLAGDDGSPGASRPMWSIFLSTSPLRGTTRTQLSGGHARPFLSTSPLRGTTGRCWP